MNHSKKILIVLLSLSLAACSANVFNSNRQTIKTSLENDVLVMLENGEDASALNDYQNNTITSNSENLPTSYDLRDLGLVTSVKNQGQLGTCWAHALVAAAETSALKNLGLTNDEYLNLYGEEINFSEKAFSYYGLTQIKGSEEGFVYLEDGNSIIYNSGSNEKGIMGMVANAVELYDEEEFPYCNENGEVDYGGVWTLAESERYNSVYCIDEVKVLPSTNLQDENGNYEFNQDSLNIIKQELLNNNAVIVSYHADATVSPLSYEEVKERLWDELKNDYQLSDQEAESYIRFRAGIVDTHDMPLEEILDLISFRLKINDFPSDLYDVNKYSKDDLAYLLASEYFGQDADLVIEYEKDQPHYMHQDPNNNIYCHYTYKQVMANHMVTIVGYDDNYSKENFTKGHEPKNDGAFIVKNSWSPSWANDGYFYLSYYDKSIQAPTVVSVSEKKEDFTVLTNDQAQFLDVSSILLDKPVLQANILEVKEDSSIFALATYTDNLNTEVTYSIYKLNDNYKNVTDGQLLFNTTLTIEYAGYHRLYLDEEIKVNKDDKLAIVISQKVNNQYALLMAYGFADSYLIDLNNESFPYEVNIEKIPSRYIKTKVNENESYISYDSKTWLDYSKELKTITQDSSILKYVNFDNPPAKIYLH